MSPDPLLDPSVDPNNTFARILQKWRETFPEKPQPRANNKTLQAKFKARMKSPHFRTNWEQALVVSTKSEFLRNSSWFDLGWFLKNEENYEKCLDGKYTDSYSTASPNKPNVPTFASKGGVL